MNCNKRGTSSFSNIFPANFYLYFYPLFHLCYEVISFTLYVNHKFSNYANVRTFFQYFLQIKIMGTKNRKFIALPERGTTGTASEALANDRNLQPTFNEIQSQFFDYDLWTIQFLRSSPVNTNERAHRWVMAKVSLRFRGTRPPLPPWHHHYGFSYRVIQKSPLEITIRNL